MSTQKKSSSLSLKEWIDREGILVVARALQVHESTVRHWRRNYCLPRTEQLIKIEKLSRGRVRIDDIVRNYNQSPYRPQGK